MNQANWIDLRSDTVTEPSQTMRDAMAAAPVGDDVYGDDPTVNRLQDFGAELFGYEAGMFAPSGTQTNLIALMTHCGRGDEYLVGQEAHTYKYEGGGAAVLGSIQPQPIANQPDGSIALSDIGAYIKPDDMHFARTRLLALENTIGGRVLGTDYMAAATAFAHARGLATHLDGARICNAAVKQGISLADAVAGFDTVSVCLSKGLGAPIGSLLLGPKAFIEQGKRWRKMLGGGMRQAGVIAAAAQHALEHNVARLADDHTNAARLAEGLGAIDGLTVDTPQTNIFYIHMDQAACDGLRAAMAREQIRATVGPHTRLVTHWNVSADDVEKVIRVISAFFSDWKKT
ncbi:low-specificity L-threonine aldolase [Massilia sp. S19_KUP03_FR1]|uniref:low-specificity L-threonine aldolase n=1 Tax=Massilia sp. S19_KUP03_FR1 TaxID=3025503 RepID=UPI002FCDA7C1